MLIWDFFSKLILSKKKKKKDYFSEKLTKILGFEPKNVSLYKEALTHRSFSKISYESYNFERLEFLGDSVIGLVTSDYLFNIAPNKREGYLSQMRSKIVSRKKLNSVSKSLKLLEQIRRDKKSNLSEDIHGDLYEAFVGAIYLDYGLDKCKDFINKSIFNNETIDKLEKQITSYKSLLLECSQKHKFNLIFKTQEEQDNINHSNINNNNNIFFICSVIYNDEVVAKGRASSKKKSEEIAAKRAYYSLKNKITKLDF